MDVIIRGQKTLLVPLEQNDVHKILEWVRDSKVSERCVNREFYKEDRLINWFDEKTETSSRYILKTVDNVSIGMLFLDIYDNIGYVNMIIGDRIYSDKAYVTDVIKTLVKHCFEVIGLDRIVAAVKKGNLRGEYLYFSCGFKLDHNYAREEYGRNANYMTIHKNHYIGY